MVRLDMHVPKMGMEHSLEIAIGKNARGYFHVEIWEPGLDLMEAVRSAGRAAMPGKLISEFQYPYVGEHMSVIDEVEAKVKAVVAEVKAKLSSEKAKVAADVRAAVNKAVAEAKADEPAVDAAVKAAAEAVKDAVEDALKANGL